jgi:D-amino-acid dehydrogenase
MTSAPLPRSPAPRHVAIVGAGMVGLATAWFLQEHGVEVTVLERDRVAAGASWGNAGWLTPSLAAPLPDPAALRYGVRALLSPSSPVYVPLSADRQLLRFLASFVRHSTAARWRVAMRALSALNRRSLDAFDALSAGGVNAPTHEAEPFLACYRTQRERVLLLEELEHIREAGQTMEFDLLDGEEARRLEPAISVAITSAIRLHGQRFIDPPLFVSALAESVRRRGGDIREGTAVRDVWDHGTEVAVQTAGEERRYDALVLATGTWLGGLAGRFGVRTVVQAGRGYSFAVRAERMPTGPIYFPTQRVACTPLGYRLRIAGMMEFRSPTAPLDPRRISAIVDAINPLLRDIDLTVRTDEWVGPRPCTPDGLPLIGPTRSPRVFVAGGHGMWGISLGPLTGQLLAETIATGRPPPELTPLDPLR